MKLSWDKCLWLSLQMIPGLCQAEGSGKYETFLRTTEFQLEDAERDVVDLASRLGSSERQASPQTRRIERIVAKLRQIRGKIEPALAGVDRELGKANSCALPNDAEREIARARLLTLSQAAKGVADLLQTVNLAAAEEALSKPRNSPGIGAPLETTKLRLNHYLKNLEEIRAWLAGEQNSGLTAEVIARKPACAGRVVASVHLYRPAYARAAEEAAPVEESVFRVDFKSVKSYDGSGSVR